MSRRHRERSVERITSEQRRRERRTERHRARAAVRAGREPAPKRLSGRSEAAEELASWQASDHALDAPPGREWRPWKNKFWKRRRKAKEQWQRAAAQAHVRQLAQR